MGASDVASQKKLNRWLNQLEKILNDGTREYTQLDHLLNAATIELVQIKQAKQRKGETHAEYTRLVQPAFHLANSLQQTGARDEQRL